MNPTDNTLNKDLDDAVKRHVAYTYYLDRDDPRKFSMATPAEGFSAYSRCWNNPPVGGDSKGLVNNSQHDHGSPSNERILADIKKFEEALMGIWKADGTVVKENNKHVKREGHRAEESRELTRKFWGGKRIKQVNARDKYWIHSDARVAWDGLIDLAKKLTKIKLEKLEHKPKSTEDIDRCEDKKPEGHSKTERHNSNEMKSQKDLDCQFDTECVDLDLINLSAGESDSEDQIKIKMPEMEENDQECLDPDAY